MKTKKKAVGTIILIALIGAVLIASLFLQRNAGSTVEMENLSGPIDNIAFEHVGEETYSITITMDNGDVLRFNMNISATETTVSSMSV